LDGYFAVRAAPAALSVHLHNAENAVHDGARALLHLEEVAGSAHYRSAAVAHREARVFAELGLGGDELGGHVANPLYT
jgi:hypothetical protein